MNKLLWALVPACITFGPLFMTRIFGTARPDAGDRLVIEGVLMLSAGLGIMFKIMSNQQKLIQKLLSERRASS